MVPRRYLTVFALLTSCFALWGLLNNMTDNLVPAFQKIFRTSQSTAGYVQACPELTATAATPPSSAAIFFSKASTVGLASRV